MASEKIKAQGGIPLPTNRPYHKKRQAKKPGTDFSSAKKKRKIREAKERETKQNRRRRQKKKRKRNRKVANHNSFSNKSLLDPTITDRYSI